MKSNKKYKCDILDGTRIGRLTVVEKLIEKTKNGSLKYLCKCDCGNQKIIKGANLYSTKTIKATQSCGCLQRESIKLIFKDLEIIEIGSRVGQVTILKELEIRNKNGSKYFLCKCDCGKEIKTTATRLRIKHKSSAKYSTIESCGCLRSERRLSGGKNPPGLNIINKLVSDYITGAKHRGYSNTLTWDEHVYLFKQNCYYCNLPPSNILKAYNSSYIYSGIDRIDNTIGYTIDNVVSSCKKCNIAKFSGTQLNFIKWIKSLYEFKETTNILIDFDPKFRALNQLISKYKTSAKQRKLKYDLDKETAIFLFKGACIYCKKSPYRIFKIRAKKEYLYVYNGIDRVDNRQGYIKENVVSCCTQCNYSKRDLSVQEFKDWTLRAYNHMKSNGIFDKIKPKDNIYKNF